MQQEPQEQQQRISFLLVCCRGSSRVVCGRESGSADGAHGSSLVVCRVTYLGDGDDRALGRHRVFDRGPSNLAVASLGLGLGRRVVCLGRDARGRL